MTEKHPQQIKILNDFLKWAGQFSHGQYLFLGVSKDTYEIEASACRRLAKEDRKNPHRLLKITQELIHEARLLGHDRVDGQRLSDLELLAQLQHYGAATCLIDFSRNSLVAFWMACQSIDENNKAHGRVFAVRSDNLSTFRRITPELLEHKTINYFYQKEHTGYPLYQWQPKYQNNRIIAQQSVFIFGGTPVEVADDCIILRGSKRDILTSLRNVSGITEATLFPDFDGFARLNAHDKSYNRPTPERSLQLGIQAHLDGRLDDAIAQYGGAILSINSEGD